MNNTWVKLYRKINMNSIMGDPTALQLFVWVLTNVDKETGQVDFGRYFVAKQLKVNPNTLYSALKRLVSKYKVCEISSTGGYTTIRLLNWTKYQPSKEDINTNVNTSSTTTQHITRIENKDKDIYIDKSIVKTYGNPQINELIAYMKKRLNLELLDDSEKRNRQYAHLCIKKFGFDKTKIAIDATAESRFWHTKITSFKSLYYNTIQIVSSLRGEVKSVDATKVLVSKNERREGISAIAGGVRAIEGRVS